MHVRLLCLLFTSFVALPAMAQETTVPQRQVSLPASNDLVVGHQARQGRAVLLELVPKGETVQNFSRMVTLQTAPGMGRVPEGAFLDEFAKRYTSSCPGTKMTAVPLGENGTQGIRLDCPRHPATGKTETVFVRAIGLGVDLGVVNITMRFLPMPQDGHWARDYLGKVTVR